MIYVLLPYSNVRASIQTESVLPSVRSFHSIHPFVRSFVRSFARLLVRRSFHSFKFTLFLHAPISLWINFVEVLTEPKPLAQHISLPLPPEVSLIVP